MESLVSLRKLRRVFNTSKFSITSFNDNTIVLQHFSNKKMIIICSNSFYDKMLFDRKNYRKNCRVFYRVNICIYIPLYLLKKKIREIIINNL